MAKKRVKPKPKAPACTTKYGPHMDVLAQGFAQLGYTYDAIIKACGISSNTYNKWMKEQPSFADAIQKGRDLHDSTVVESALLRSAIGYDYDEITSELTEDGGMVETKKVKKRVTENVSAIRLWLANRHPDRWGNVTEETPVATVVINMLPEPTKEESNGK